MARRALAAAGGVGFDAGMPELPTRRALLAVAAAAATAGPALAAAYWPGAGGWTTQDAGEAGFDEGRLGAALDAAMAARSRGLLALRDGRIVAERYASGWGVDRTMDVASVGKSLLAVLLGMAIEDGHIRGLDQPAAAFIPQWLGTPKAAITLRHLLSMTSGLDDAGLAVRDVAGDQFAINAAAVLKDPPGTRWRYNTPAYHLLFHVLARAAGEPLEAYAQRRLLGPLGMVNTTWLTSPGQGDQGPVSNYYSALSSTRDLGRFGLFALNGGQWAGRRLVSAAFVRAMTQPSQALNPSYGLLWWLNGRPGVNAAGGAPGLRFPGSPPDTVAALGAGGQAVMVVPSRRLVVVRQGLAPGPEDVLPRLLAGVIGAQTRD